MPRAGFFPGRAPVPAGPERIRTEDLLAEFGAEWRRFIALVGRPPCMVDGHKHIHIFPQIGW